MDIRQMASTEIEEQITEFEVAYAEGLASDADVHYLSAIWRRIKDLKRELRQRSSQN